MMDQEREKNYYYGHASGQFKEVEKHYHTTFKEALTIKNGINNFDFHLRGHQLFQMESRKFDFKSRMRRHQLS